MPSAEDPPQETLVFNRTAARRWAKQKILALKSVLDAADDIERDARERTNEARVRHRQTRMSARLKELSVQDLARRSGLRPSILIDHGFRTAQDVRDAGFETLRALHGIGDPSARQWVQLASNAARIQSADLQPPPDRVNWLKADYDLIQALEVLASVGSLLGLPQVAMVQQLLAALRLFARATSWLHWLFSGKKKRSDIRSEYPRIRFDVKAAQYGGAFDDMVSILDQAARLVSTPVSDNEVWKGWLNSSADLIALLEKLIADYGTKEERTVIDDRLLSDALSGDVLERIRQVTLDTSLLRKTLRNYQEFGARFAVAVGRGLLGDEMGLGKTIQALAAIAHVINIDGQRHHVVICPAALIDNWLREIQETTKALDGWAFRDRDQGRQGALQEWRANGGILLTSFEQSGHLASADLPSIGFVIVDEAHNVKNPSAKRTAWTAELLNHANRALLMGGTMLENRTEELIRLAGLAHSSYELRLRERFGDGSTAHHQADEFRHALGEFYLRRNQSKVLKELPGIVSTQQLVVVGNHERRAYEAALKQRNLNRARIALAVGGGVESEKMEYLRAIVDECKAEDRKLLVFTEFLDVLDTAAGVVGETCSVIRGGMPDKKKLARMDDFRNSEGFDALAMQIRVGGVGHNLQAASVVVLMEPQLKPSTEWQAIRRAHRMGQPLRVSVHRLVAKDSVEERIVELTDFKAELFDKLARDSELAASLADRDQRVSPGQLLEFECHRLGLDDE